MKQEIGLRVLQNERKTKKKDRKKEANWLERDLISITPPTHETVEGNKHTSKTSTKSTKSTHEHKRDPRWQHAQKKKTKKTHAHSLSDEVF